MLELLKDLWGFMKVRKKFWLAPIIIILLLLGALIVLSQGSAVAPFIYTLFQQASRLAVQEQLRYHPAAHENLSQL